MRWVQGPGTAGANDAGTRPDEIWSKGDNTTATGVTPRGAIESQWNSTVDPDLPGTRPTRVRMRAEDSGPDGEDGAAIRLVDVSLELLDPETGVVRTKVVAGSARVKREDAGTSFTPRFANQMTLYNVELTVWDGAPIVPITLRVSELDVDLATRTLRSEQAVDITGDHLSGSGTGLFVDEPGKLLRLHRDGVLRFESGDDQGSATSSQGSLRSTGALEITRSGPIGEEVLIIRGDGGSRLETRADDEWLDAETIELRGTEDSDGGFLLSTLNAVTDVVYVRGPHELRGDRARVHFDATGEPERAQVAGSAHARLTLADAELPPDAPRVEGDTVDISSEERMDIVWEEDGVHFTAAGPAVVEGGGARLMSDGDVSAVAAPGGDRAFFTFSDGVHLERDGAVLVTRDLTAEVSRDEEGRTVLTATAEGRPLLTGTDRQGRDFLLSSTGPLGFHQVGELWSVPTASGVQLTVMGENGFRARADRVRDFDPEKLALQAEGNIEIESDQGTGRGERLSVDGRERFTLLGTAAKKATFEGPEGSGEARLVRRDGSTLYLEGDVTGDFKPSAGSGETYGMKCDELTVKRTVLGAPIGSENLFDLTAKGSVEARVEGLADRLDLTCEHFVGHHVEVLDENGVAVQRTSEFSATEVERAALARREKTDLRLRLSSDTMHGTRVETVGTDGETVIEGEAVAEGKVLFHGTYQETPFSGTAHELRVDHAGHTRALAAEDERVFFSGLLPSNGQPFEMEALWIEASPERLEAHEPEIQVSSMEAGVGGEADIDIYTRAKHMISTETWLEFQEDVYVDGITEDKIPWTLEAGRVRFEGRVGSADPAQAGGEVSALFASGGVTLNLPDREMRATGETLRAKRLSGIMRLEGSPAKIDSPALIHEAEWIELDVNLGFVVGSGKGKVRPPHGDCSEGMHQDGGEQASEGEWTIEYLSSRTLVEPDALIHVLQEPRVTYRGEELSVFLPVAPSGGVVVSASWAVMWVDRHSWNQLPDREDEDPEGPQEEAAETDRQGFFGKIRGLGILNEVYLEGPVEVRFDERPSATASAVYLDVVSGHGWLADANFTIQGEHLGRGFRTIKVHAKWLRQSADTSFHADEATIALCEFDDPHVQITTGDLRITQDPNDDNRFDVVMRDNRVEMYDLLTIPLPSIETSTDENLRPDIASVRLGDSARFGSFVSAGIVRPAEGAAKFMHDLLGRGDFGTEVDVDAKYSVDAAWFGSRGALLDLGFIMEAENEYRFITELGGIPDDSKDKGYIRVPPSDRSTLRLWLRSHGRYEFDEEQWLDFAGSYQTDAGIQSEFFESDFERYEQSENFVRWRKADGPNFYSASVKVQVNDFFSEVEELPSASVWRGRTEVLPLGPTALIYSADATAAYLRRHESQGGYASPFGGPPLFSDGFGQREVLRLDTTHRVEVPVSLGALGLRATPFAVARGTAWDENTALTGDPRRGLGQAGVRLSTALWKKSDSGRLHQLLPYVEARGDVVLEESGGAPVTFDSVESPVEGSFVEVGLRGRLGAKDGSTLLDFDAHGTHANDLATAAGPNEGWNDFGFYSRLAVDPFGIPAEVIHDGRYDFDEGDTLYSRLSFGLRPRDNLAFEAAHHRGLDLDREALYEAASITGLWTWTEKWEFEGQQTLSLRDDARLGSKVILRRYGHDLVLEIESSFRQGEGASVGISVRPLVTWDRPNVGFLGL